eukprot:9187813-Alexandrium_andersonii.AAC.1
MRALLKNSKMPSLYYAKVPVKDKRTDTTTEVDYPFLLPHELLHHMVGKNTKLLEALAQLDQPDLNRLHSEWASRFGIPKETLIPLGVFGDGVPHQKNKTIEAFTFNTLNDGERFL